MKNLFILLLLTIYGITAYGQEMHSYKISWGNELKVKKLQLDRIIAITDEGYYALSYKPHSFAFGVGLGAISGSFAFAWSNNYYSLYNNKFNLVKTEEAYSEYDDEDQDILNVIFANDNIYQFSVHKDKKKKKTNLLCQTINKKTLQPNKDIKIYSTIDYSEYSNRNNGDFQIVSSPDTSKILVISNLPYDKNQAEEFAIDVFTSDMQPMWSKKIKLPYTDDLFSLSSFRVSNDGSVFVLGKLYIGKAKERTRQGKPNYNFIVLSYTTDGEDANEYKLHLKNKFITDITIAIAPNNDIICSGFYGDNKSYSIQGSFFMKIDNASKEKIVENFKEFDVNFITQSWSEKQTKKAKKKASKGKDLSMYEYDLKDLIIRSDGGALLIAEQYYVQVVTTRTSNGGTTTTYYYHYNDIIVINIAPDGQIDWNATIAKRQLSVNDGGYYSSYSMAVVGDKLYFLFNDSPLNQNWRKGKPLYYPSYGGLFNKKNRAVLAMAMVDMEGNIVRKNLYSSKQSKLIARPKACMQINDSEMILYSRYRTKEKLGKLTFSE